MQRYVKGLTDQELEQLDTESRRSLEAVIDALHCGVDCATNRIRLMAISQMIELCGAEQRARTTSAMLMLRRAVVA